MISMYINLHSSKNQPKDELNQNLKDFDTMFCEFFHPDFNLKQANSYHRFENNCWVVGGREIPNFLFD